MKPKHTPAPWFAVDYAGSFCIQNGEMYEDKNILTYDDIWDKDAFKKEEVEANTKLICAAPEMIRLLIDSLHAIKILSDVNVKNGGTPQITIIKEIEQLIKKATE